jgi:hypothetical protein
MRRLAEQHAKTPVTGSVTATVTNAKDAGRALATGVQKMFNINVLQIDLTERATGLEPATSSLEASPYSPTIALRAKPSALTALP